MRRSVVIDSVKGFAILLVVMGHAIAWLFDDYRVLMDSPALALIWRLIYSFHMPLFVFVSGYLYGRHQDVGLMDEVCRVKRAAVVLLVPYLVTGLLLYIVHGANCGRVLRYWYLLVLFEYYALFGVVRVVLLKVGHGWLRFILELVLVVVAYMALSYGVMVLGCIRFPEFVAFSNLFWFFFVGVCVARIWPYVRVFQLLVHRLHFAVCGLLLSVGAYVFCEKLVPWLMIPTVFICFAVVNQKSKILTFLRCSGEISLQIYLLHLFFLPRMPFLGDWFCQMIMSYGEVGVALSCVLEGGYAIITSTILIIICWILASLLSKSAWVPALFLGRPVRVKIWEEESICG